MTGALLADIRSTAKKFVESGGFETEIEITDKDNNVETVKGIATLHSIMYSPETGLPITARNAHVTIANSFETINVFSDTKNPNVPTFKGFNFKFADAFENSWNFKAEDPKTTYSFGLFTIALGDVKNV